MVLATMPVRAVCGESSGRAGGLHARQPSQLRRWASKARQQHHHHYPNLGQSEEVGARLGGLRGRRGRRVVRRRAAGPDAPATPARSTSLGVTRRSRSRLRLPRGLEDHIEEALTSQSFSELDDQVQEDFDKSKKSGDFDGNGIEDGGSAEQVSLSLDANADGCCGSSSASQGDPAQANGLERQLARLFGAVGLTRYADFVHDKVAFTYVAGALLVASASIGWSASAGLFPASVPLVLLQRLAAACLCGVYAIMGVPAFLDVAYNLAALKVNIHVLTMLAVLGSVVIGSPLEGGLLLVLFESAHMIEGRLTKAAKGNLAALFEGAPKVATTVDVSAQDSAPIYATERSVRVETVQPGSHVVVKAGEIVPLDGKIVYGCSLVTSENITGESLPYRKVAGDSLPAGARTVDGTLVLQTLKTSEESTPARILKLTQAAQEKKPKITQFLDKWMNIYSKVVLLSTLCLCLALPAMGIPVFGVKGSVYRAAAFLTAAAPCALVMAPLAYITAISTIARKGVIVKGGKVIDALSRCDTIALDKTGTLTEGDLECTAIVTLDSGRSNGNGGRVNGSAAAEEEEEEEEETLSIALAVSQGSTHPISKAIKKCASQASVSNGYKVSDFRQIPGYGVEASVSKEGKEGKGYRIQFGSVNFVSEYLSESSTEEVSRLIESTGQDKVVAVLRYTEADDASEPLASQRTNGTSKMSNGNGNGNTVGGGNGSGKERTTLFTFADKIKSKSASAIDDLQHSSQLKVSMLTGDHEANALFIAKELGISQVYAGLLPEDKVEYVEKMRRDISSSGYVAMVGDGINDAPALATADVGIAFANSTSAAAATAADAIVLKEGSDHISSLPYLFRVARKTRNIMKQNIALAMVSILGASLPSVAGKIPLWLSVSVHEGSTLLVALNSLRCLLPESKGPVESALRKVVWPLAIAAALLVVTPNHLLAQAGKWVTGALPLEQLARWGISLGAIVLLMESASAGLFAGALHSLTGPDHLAALAPLSMGRSSIAAGFLGGLWGFGHSMGQLFFGALFIMLKSKLNLNLDIIENFAGGAIGVTLIAIGYLGYQEAKHFDFDQMKDGQMRVRKRDKLLSKFSIATFGTGFLHGLSPDAIFPILPAITLSTKAGAFAFVIAFVVGTIGSMASYTAFIGVGSSALAQKSPDITKRISQGSSFVAIVLGITLILSAVFGIDLIGNLMPTGAH